MSFLGCGDVAVTLGVVRPSCHGWMREREPVNEIPNQSYPDRGIALNSIQLCDQHASVSDFDMGLLCVQ